MQVALVHELLTMRGGAERTLKVLADMFPEAPIYTLLYDERKLGDWFPKERVRTSRLQKYAWISKNHHLYLRRFSKAVESFDFSGFDLVISSSSAFVHGIKTKPGTKHICYVHSPARYLWDRTHDVLEQAKNRLLGFLPYTYLTHVMCMLRKWDASVADRPDVLIAASNEVKRRIELYWRRESEVIYPPVEVADFALSEAKRGDSYIIVSTLVPYKRIELAIEACNKLKRNLKIIGDGPYRKKLEKIAGPTIEFLGYQKHDVLVSELQNAKAFIFPGEEDFGIAPVEAMACGTPVIAYGKGGALETVVGGETGIFFKEPTSDSLAKAIEEFEGREFDAKKCRERVELFSRKRFEEGILRLRYQRPTNNNQNRSDQ